VARQAAVATPRSPLGWWLLSCAIFVAVPHLLRMPALLVFGCVALIAWRLAYQSRGFPLPGRALRIALTVSMLALVLLSHVTLIGPEAGAHLLVAMLLLKLLEARAERDVALLVVVAFFATVSTFFLTQSPLVAGLALISIVLLLTTLVALVHPVNSWSLQRAHLRHVLRLTLQALPLTALLFVLFPRISAPLWGLPEDSARNRTGLSDTLAPGQVSELSDDDSVAFRVEFADGAAPKSMYWRGLVLWHFDGNAWRAPAQLTRSTGATPRTVLDVGGEAVRYSVTAEAHYQHWLFGLDMPATVPRGLQRTSSFELLLDDRLRERFRYELSSYLQYHLDAHEMPDARYLELPSGYGARARALASSWRAREQNDRAVVQAALRHFATQPFYYTRQPPLLFDDLVDEFLFESRRGFCEHYAASLAFLMRAAGIPARIVIGYQGGERNPLGKYYIVRQSDAHAWTEVWLEGEGWRRVDSTAALPPERVESGTQRGQGTEASDQAALAGEAGWLRRAAAVMALGWDNLHYQWNRWISGYDRRRQAELMDNLGLSNVTWSHLAALLGASLSATVLLLAAGLFIRRRAQRDPVRQLYARFCRKLSRKGLEPRRFDTATMVQRRVDRRLPERSPEVAEILRLYYSLRYRPSPEADTLQALRRAVRRLQV